MVFQSFALWPHLTVREHLEFPLRHHRFVDPKIRKNPKERIDETMEITGLLPLAGRYPSQLSGGQRQRVALGRAVVVRPAVLLMDEPLSALDAGLRLAMREEIQRVHRLCGCTVLYVTHDQSEALAMSNRIIIMNSGAIEQDGSPADIYYRPASAFAARFVSNSNLLRGSWQGDAFSFGETSTYKWIVPNVEGGLKREGICPLRPEELRLSRSPEGLPGIVRNIQFQGRDNHYIITTRVGNLRVHIPGRENYHVGQEVFIGPRENHPAKIMSV